MDKAFTLFALPWLLSNACCTVVFALKLLWAKYWTTNTRYKSYPFALALLHSCTIIREFLVKVALEIYARCLKTEALAHQKLYKGNLFISCYTIAQSIDCFKRQCMSCICWKKVQWTKYLLWIDAKGIHMKGCVVVVYHRIICLSIFLRLSVSYSPFFFLIFSTNVFF